MRNFTELLVNFYYILLFYILYGERTPKVFTQYVMLEKCRDSLSTLESDFYFSIGSIIKHFLQRTLVYNCTFPHKAMCSVKWNS